MLNTNDKEKPLFAKVIYQSSRDTYDKYETRTTGLCSYCGEVVQKHAKGFDEYCPGCGCYLEW